MLQKGDTSLIDLLNEIRVGHIDESSEMTIQSRYIDSEDSLPIEIKAIDIIPSNCGFTESDIIAAQNI